VTLLSTSPERDDTVLMSDPFEAGAAATDYLRLFGLTALAHIWARTAGFARFEGLNDW